MGTTQDTSMDAHRIHDRLQHRIHNNNKMTQEELLVAIEFYIGVLGIGVMIGIVIGFIIGVNFVDQGWITLTLNLLQRACKSLPSDNNLGTLIKNLISILDILSLNVFSLS